MRISIVAAAVLAVAAIPSAFASTASEREYQRGYKDCQHGRYDQNQHGESYKKGCRAAEDEQASRPAAAKQAPAKKGGHSAKLSDLKGMDSVKAFDVMASRGFAGVDTITSGDTIYGIYYNAETHQCVQLTNANNRVESVNDIGTHPNCR